MCKKLIGVFKKNKFSAIYYTVILIVFFLSRLVCLSKLPRGMHIDEISMGYNVWSLSRYGTDRYGVSYPIYFDNDGSGQSSLYIYVATILAKVFGYSIVTLRLPAVLFGLLLLIFVSLSAYKMFGKNCAYIASAVVTVMPVFVMGERFAFDCNAFLPMFSMVLYFGIKSTESDKWYYQVLLGLSISLCFYSYILSLIIIPSFLLVTLIYLFLYKRISLSKVGMVFLTAGIFSLPMICYILVLTGVLSSFNIGAISITPASIQRVSEVGYQGKPLSIILKNLFEITDHDNYNFVANEKFGVFYANRVFGGLSLSQVLLLIAFVFVLTVCIIKNKRKEFNYETIIIIALFSTLTPLYFTEGFATYRYESFLVVCVFLISCMFDFMITHKLRVISLLICIIFLFNFGSYLIYIFGGNFEKDSLVYFDSDLLSLCENINFKEYEDYQFYIDDTATYNTGLIVLYALRVPPSDTRGDTTGTSGRQYGNIHIGIPEDVKDEKAVYIIKDLSKESSLYTDIDDSISVYKKILNGNKARNELLGIGAREEVYNGYDIYYIEN